MHCNECAKCIRTRYAGSSPDNSVVSLRHDTCSSKREALTLLNFYRRLKYHDSYLVREPNYLNLRFTPPTPPLTNFVSQLNTDR